MTPEEKDLLLKDICARLAYNPFCKVDGLESPVKLIRVEVDSVDGILLDFDWKNKKGLPLQVYLSEVKPYLRSISSMTEEEKEEFNTIWEEGFSKALDLQIETDLKSIENFSFEGNYDNVRYLEIITAFNTIQWLLSKHFDLGLIEKGLALEASEEMYK